MQQSGFVPDYNFAKAVEAEGPFNLSACFQCRKCTNGCPLSFEMDLYPDQVIRLALLGQKDEVLRSKTIWVCASCATCSTRCPNGIQIPELMDCFKEMAVNERVRTPQPQVVALHQSFLGIVSLAGRIFEGALLPLYILKSGQLRSKIREGTWRHELQLGLDLLRKGRLSLLPTIISGKGEVNTILSSLRKQEPRS